MSVPITRRRLLLTAGGAGFLHLVGCASSPSKPSSNLPADPFALGVASGEPSRDGFVIWTRLTQDALGDESGAGGMPPTPVDVGWLVAEDEKFEKVVQQGAAVADPAWGHSVHVEVTGLQPDRPYWYAFRTGKWRSRSGRARTIPISGAPTDTLRFAYASCQHYETGHYAAWRDLVAQDPQLVVFLGDYLYETNAHSADERVRQHVGPEPRTLGQYRRRHAQYRLDPALQAAHAHCPWFMTWDDHDVRNDYAGLNSPDDEPPAAFAERRAAAYQAWWEHMPLRARARPSRGEAQLFNSADIGDLIRLNVLDTRQYRDDQPCGTPTARGGQVVENCQQALDPARTMLGAAQEQWLTGRLASSSCKWNVIAQSLLFAPLDEKPGPGEAIWTDGWDGMPAARTRLLRMLDEQGIANPIVIGGDIHSFWACDLRVGDRYSSVVATEFTGTSISSTGVPYDQFVQFLPDNPHVKFFDSRSRGYVLCDVRGGRWTTQFRAVDDVRNPDSASRTLATFSVESGRPGVQAGS